MAGLIGLLAVPSNSAAQHMDLELWRLGNPRPIELSDGTSVSPYLEADDRFRLLMVDLGLAMHPTPTHPANTLGRAGTAFEFSLRLPQIHPGATVQPGDRVEEGDCPPGNPQCRIWVIRGTAEGYAPQRPPPSRLIVPTIQLRKGLPASFELNSKIHYLTGSSMVGLSGGLRWALNEGFDFLPDLSVGGQGTRLVGTKGFGLTTFSADVLLGKWFPIAGSATFGPYLGWQRVWVHAVSSVIDFNPGHEAADNPTGDDSIFDTVNAVDNGYDRVVFGLRVKSYVAQFLLEGSYQPDFLGLDPAFNIIFMVGVDF